MMGHIDPLQGKLFYAHLNIDKHIRMDHSLRKTDQFIDFDFVYNEIKDQYGTNGNVSIPPPLIFKLMLLLVFYNIRSERELMYTLPERLDWLWFLGYDLDTDIPDHAARRNDCKNTAFTGFVVIIGTGTFILFCKRRKGAVNYPAIRRQDIER